jgi:hypothetical protein
VAPTRAKEGNLLVHDVPDEIEHGGGPFVIVGGRILTGSPDKDRVDVREMGKGRAIPPPHVDDPDLFTGHAAALHKAGLFL